MPYPALGRASRPWPAVCLFFLLALIPVLSASETESSPRILTTAAEVRHLDPEQAASGLPVRLKGVVTFHDGAVFSRFIQDATAGIYFQEYSNMPPFSAGNIVEMEGVTGPGEFAPIVITRSLRVLGPGAMPVAKKVSIEEVITGWEDSQFIEIRATVRAVRFDESSENFVIDMVAGGERFAAYARQLPLTNTLALVDSVVKVRGVCATLFNRQRQLFGFRLLVPSASDMTVEIPPPNDPFSVPLQGISSLLRFTAQNVEGRRVKIRGTVVHQEPGTALFVQDEREGLYCQTRDTAALQSGDEVEVIGFPAKGEYTPVMQDASYRMTGKGKKPVALDIDLDGALAGTYDCRLVRVTGKLLEQPQRGMEQFLVLEKNGVIFYAYLAKDTGAEALLPLGVGSELAVTGICLIERGSAWLAGENWRAKGFRILLRTPQDVEVLKMPPWLNVRRVLWMMGGLAFLAVASFGWVGVLQRQVSERTNQLEAQIQERQRAERSREIEQERARVAHDLHDDLGAGLTEVNMLSSLAKSRMTSPEEKERYLDELTHTAERMVTSLDEIVWAVNPRNDTVASLASYFGAYAQRLLDLAGISCGLAVAEDLPDYPLDPKFRQDLFFAFKEAITNVLRHSRATQVWLRISVIGHRLSVEVTDNGCGLAGGSTVPGADGLINMRERLASLGGECKITSDKNKGTTVRLCAPMPERLL